MPADRTSAVRQSLRRATPEPTWRPSGSTETWPLSSALLISLAVSAVALSPMLQGIWWWVVAVATALIVTIAMAATRLLLVGRGWPVLTGLVALVLTLSLFFAAPSSVLGLIPSPETIDAFSSLVQTGIRSINSQKVPAEAVTGILFLVAASFGIMAILLDVLAIVLRRAALTGIVLLVIVLTPTIIGADLADPFFFLLAGIAWLVVLHVSSPFAHLRGALAIGGASLAVSLVLQLFIFPIPPEPVGDRNGIGYITGINPILTLGENLRRQDPITAITYTTDAIEQSYITFSVLDVFDDDGWHPDELRSDESTDIGNIGRAPGLSDGVPFDETTSVYTIGDIGGGYLPVPYAPTSITGLVGEWTWDDETLAIRTEGSSMRAQKYVVEANVPQPTVADMERQDEVPDPNAAAFLDLPASMPLVISETALEVTEGDETRFDQALSLQRYFRGGGFVYSETAPVEQGYDGNDAQIIARFLQNRSGYCQHFASSMAVMARTLGIPARVAVGFTPGQKQNDDNGEYFLVTTSNLHAWPELYFTGVGWVRFEPTPGRGDTPVFSLGDPNEPQPNSTDSPSPTPTIEPATPLPTTAPTPTPEPTSAANAPGSTTAGPPLWLLALAVLILLAVILPSAIRGVQRGRARSAAAGGDALAAWAELDATARDLRLQPSDSATPREFEALLLGTLGVTATNDPPPAAEPLARLRGAVETAVYDEIGSERSTTIAADLNAVLRAMRRASGRWARVLAWVAPSSLAWGAGNRLAARRARAWARREVGVPVEDVIPPSLRDDRG